MPRHRHFKHIRTFLVLLPVLWLFLAKMMITAREVQDPGYEVYTHIVTGKRSVLLFFSQNTFVIVSSYNGNITNNRLNDTFVFDLVQTSPTSVLLKNMQHFTTRWPMLTGPYVNMVAVGEFLIFVDANNGPSVLDLKTGTISEMSLDQASLFALAGNWLLSSSVPPTFYCINSRDRFLYYRATFDNANIAQSTTIEIKELPRYLCRPQDDQIISSKIGCKKEPVYWHINAGFVDGIDFVLLGMDNALFRFSMTIFDSRDSGGSVPLQRITPHQFWHYQKPTLPPTNATTVPNSTTASPRHNPIIWICVVLLLIFIFIVGGYIAYQNLFKESPQRVYSSDSLDKATSYASKKVRSPKKHRNSSTRKKTKKVSLDQSKVDAPALAISSSTSASLIIGAGLKIPPTDIQLLPPSGRGQSSSSQTKMTKGEPYSKTAKMAESKKLNIRKMTPAMKMKRNFSIRALPPTDSTKRRSSGKRSSYHKQSSGRTNHSKRTSMRSLK